MKPRIAIVGNGNVGTALERGARQAGYEVRSVGHDPEAVRALGEWGELIILAVPFPAVQDTLAELGEAVNGKILVDVTNALTQDMRLAVGRRLDHAHDTSSQAEELQLKAAGAKVVKAFNTVFAGTMDSGHVDDEQLTLFAAGDDPEAKAVVLELGRAIGFDAVDAGPLQNARWLEVLGFFNIQLGYVLKMGTQIGFKLVHAAPDATTRATKPEQPRVEARH